MAKENSTGIDPNKCQYCDYVYKNEKDKVAHNTPVDSACCGRCRNKPPCYYCAGMWCYCGTH